MRLSTIALAALGLAAPLASVPAEAQDREPRARTVVRHTGRAPETDDYDVRVPPPPPRQVTRPPRPFADAVWTDGYWMWNGHAHVWVDGVWMRPVPGRRWSPWRWEETNGHWTLIPGGWVPDHQGRL